MRPALLASVLGLALLATPSAGAPPTGSTRLWFTPGPGTVDMLRLFEAPHDWETAREAIDVFEFYQGHTLTQAGPGEGPNRYDAFVRVDAFRKLARWGKRVAIEVASVKEHYCTPDATGMQAAVDATLESLRNVHAGGGRVAYIAMDEPFVSGLSRRCGGPGFAPTADRLAAYIPAVRRAFPAVRIGLIEPYPGFSVAQFTEIMRLLAARGLAVDFLHADARRPDTPVESEGFGGGLLQLRDLAAQYGIPFGVIIWGDPGDSDALYAADALRNADELGAVFRRWEVMPDRVLIQSWARSRSGQYITPRNLPEGQQNTHAWLVNEINRRLRTPKGRTLLPVTSGS